MGTADKYTGLPEIFLTFTRIGLTGFGGGMAIAALTERVCVHEKQWLSQEEFLHGLTFGQLLGPFSLNVCTFIGYRLRGISGGVAAAVGFLLPSFLLISLLSRLYFTYNRLPQLQAALRGTNPVIIGLILVVAIDMGRKQFTGAGRIIMGAAAFLAIVLLRMNAALILLGAAAWALAGSLYRRRHC